jgi:hypothetical protein
LSWNALDLEICGQSGNHHSLNYRQSAGKSGPFAIQRVFRFPVPDLAVGTITIPTEITHRNGSHRKELETPEQSIFLRDLYLFTQYFYSDKPLERIVKIRIER